MPKIKGKDENGNHIDSQIIQTACNIDGRKKVTDNYVNNRGYDTDDSMKY